MATIKMRTNKDGSRVFRIRVKVDSVEYQKTWPEKSEKAIPITWSDKKANAEAMKIAAAFEEACRQGQVSNDKRTLYEYANYVIDMKEKAALLKPSTVAWYRTLLPRLKNAKVGSMKVRDVRVKNLNEFYCDLREEKSEATGKLLSTRTVHAYHVMISSVMHQAAREGIIMMNPCVNCTLPKQESKEADFYPPEKMIAILNAIKNEPLIWQAMTDIFVGIGARRGEVLGLRWSDIDFKNGVIMIRRNITKAGSEIVECTPKTGEGRQVSIDLAFLDNLKAWRAEQTKNFGAIPVHGYCFALEGPDDVITPDAVTRFYARLGKKYDLGHVHPHAFRHTQASIILQDGDIITASRRLGHSRTSTTLNTYGHMMPQTDKAAASKVWAAIQAAQ